MVWSVIFHGAYIYGQIKLEYKSFKCTVDVPYMSVQSVEVIDDGYRSRQTV